jgi:N-acetylglutamate synthase-like GNAT family acetyltransferase
MQIDFLADHPRYIACLAPALLEHWRFALPEDTLAVRAAKLGRHLSRQELPIAWVAHQNGEVFGTAALRMHDLEDRTDLSPWLGGVFVLPAYRNRGIGSALCETVERHAAAMGVSTLYLFTIDRQALYARLHWQDVETTRWRGFGATIMSKNLSAATAA